MIDSYSSLAKTAIHGVHQRLGAKLVPFAGYEMPVQYPLGVLKEHLHTRAAAGLFDVSHMGQIRLTGEDVAQALEALVPVDIIDLPVGQQRYALFTNEQGGILDDLMITRCEDHYLLVVNAACKERDVAYLRSSLPASILLEELNEKALIALQGPLARKALSQFCPEVQDLVFMQTATVSVAGIDCFVSCSGYTGEDGYEISVDNCDAESLVEKLLEAENVEPIGLGARDSLRLEAGLCLYGHDLDEQTTPIEANLLWAISKVRRPQGQRSGGYPGATVIEDQIENGVSKKRLMFTTEGRAPVREGADIVNAKAVKVGIVSSGGFGPTIGGPVVMAYVDSDHVNDTDLFALVRNKSLPLQRVSGSLLPSRYYRG
ncbi:MAG: aminomethyltransferase [Oceanicoccus sp.]